MNIGKRRNKEAAQQESERSADRMSDAERVSAMDQAANIDENSGMRPDSGATQPGMQRVSGDADQPYTATPGFTGQRSAAAETGRLDTGASNPSRQQHPVTPDQSRGMAPDSEHARGAMHSGAAGQPGGPGRTDGNGGDRLLAEGDMRHLRDRWHEVQTRFVDDPQQAVQQADQLVDNTIAQLTETCASRRRELENRWSRGENVDTEALRQALRGYRDLFDQLVGTASAARNM
ncbi:hypothetical protein H0264_22905 [Nocardia huaxiensis]|uniref:Uncharacterized protein n=1 Tax=Nocardia huaxiensis TaxID=2755382 RepID=A0A7D6VEG5_9NOCA|nr:hypothetical protein [Nocardia huaxiensis]QLY28236.1 hypothetical protein H0264_22905 [Nocardia huaxiensis]